MTVASAVVARLLSLSAVTMLVGTRVRPLKFRQTETFPAIRVQRISEIQPMHLRGAVTLFRSLVQVDTYVEDVGDAYATAVAIDAAVHGDGAGSGLCSFTGLAGTVEMAAVIPRGVSDEYELDAGGRRFVRILREYEVQHRG